MSGSIFFRTSTVLDIKKDYHENAVARASSLQTGCRRYIFIIVGAACGMDIHPE
jgi:hypothetical protein